MAEPVPIGVEPEVRVITAARLLREFKPIESVVDGLPIPRGGVAAITANTGHGKTTIATALEIAFCTGRAFAGREVTRGSVLVLAGENPDDYTMHLAATLQAEGLTVEDVMNERRELLIVPGVFNIDYELDKIRRDCGPAANLVAVIVDTSAAFFAADEENDNVAMRRHASQFRELTNLPGRPAVIVLCHPTKKASADNLLPRGGGAFLNEIDANLTLWKDEGTSIVSLGWLGKIRGATFDPVRFELVSVELAGFKDCRDRPIWSSAARHLPDSRAEQLQNRETNAQDRLLIALRKFPGASVGDLASEAGMVSESGQPQKSTAYGRLVSLEKLGLAERDRKGKWRLTAKGDKEAATLPC